MSLFVNAENNTISMRRNDSGVLQFVFDNDMTGVFVTFAVKADRADSDEEAVITKTYLCGKDAYVAPNVAYFYLTPEDTASLEVEPIKDKFDYQDYCWMIKLETEYGMLADTIIPSGTAKYPKFRLYYGSVPDYNKQGTLLR